jgi:hypothetical protein
LLSDLRQDRASPYFLKVFSFTGLISKNYGKYGGSPYLVMDLWLENQALAQTKSIMALQSSPFYLYKYGIRLQPGFVRRFPKLERLLIKGVGNSQNWVEAHTRSIKERELARFNIE